MCFSIAFGLLSHLCLLPYSPLIGCFSFIYFFFNFRVCKWEKTWYLSSESGLLCLSLWSNCIHLLARQMTWFHCVCSGTCVCLCVCVCVNPCGICHLGPGSFHLRCFIPTNFLKMTSSCSFGWLTSMPLYLCVAFLCLSIHLMGNGQTQ